MHLAGNCEKPSRTRAGQVVRCRQCTACNQAARRYWAAAAVHQTELAEERGCRTWFGTLTFSPNAVDDLQTGGERLSLAVRAEVQRYWKRLRKAEHSFKYLAAFEDHLSGIPHVHFLLHELQHDRPIRKRDLEEHWSHGFVSMRLLQAGESRTRFGASNYVTKAISGDPYRRCASLDYKPRRRMRSLNNQ